MYTISRQFVNRAFIWVIEFWEFVYHEIIELRQMYVCDSGTDRNIKKALKR